MATIVKGTYVQTAKPAATFAADTTTVWSRNQLLIEEDTLRMKVGDGINIYSELKYATISPEEVQKLITDSSHTHLNKAVLDTINQEMVDRMQQEAVTPTANVRTTVDGAEITITDYKGTTTASVKSGKEINTSYNEEEETLYIGGDGGYSELTQSERDQIKQNKADIATKLDKIKDAEGNSYRLLVKDGKLYYEKI